MRYRSYQLVLSLCSSKPKIRNPGRIPTLFKKKRKCPNNQRASSSLSIQEEVLSKCSLSIEKVIMQFLLTPQQVANPPSSLPKEKCCSSSSTSGKSLSLFIQEFQCNPKNSKTKASLSISMNTVEYQAELKLLYSKMSRTSCWQANKIVSTHSLNHKRLRLLVPP